MGAGGDGDSVPLLPLLPVLMCLISGDTEIVFSHWVHILNPGGQHPTLQDVVPELVLWLSFQQDIPLLH